MIAATEEARAILCRADEVNYLSGPGKGVILIKLSGKDRVLGFIASTGDRDIMRVETSRGAEQTISTTKYEITGRGGKGRELLQRGQFTRVIPQEVDAASSVRVSGGFASKDDLPCAIIACHVHGSDRRLHETPGCESCDHARVALPPARCLPCSLFLSSARPRHRCRDWRTEGRT